MTAIFKNYLRWLEKNFPSSHLAIEKNDLIRPELISPFVLELPQSLLTQVKAFVFAVEDCVNSQTYQDQLPSDYPWQKWPTTPSLLSCFDFHYSPEQGLKLIEINTNASLYLCAQGLYDVQGIDSPDPRLEKLKHSFVTSLSLEGRDPVAIIDRNPEEEGLYFEFLLYQEWLSMIGHPTHLFAIDKLDTHKFSKIYNRFTDFYLEEKVSAELAKAYHRSDIDLSPNPRGYFLLADKNRLPLLRDCLPQPHQERVPKTLHFSDFSSADELWSERKNYFFKPAQSYGSKAVYRGKAISRSTFEKIYSPDFLAQEYCPPDQKTFTWEGEEHTMKYDLRFYSFQGEVQSYVARLYQGQATNMRTAYGGIAPIVFQG